MLRKLLYLIIFLFSVHFLYSQSGTLKGKVLDESTGEPIPFANVIIELDGSMVSGGISDFDGNYIIKPIPAGKFTVKASYVGYSTLQLNGVLINTDKIRFLDLKLPSSTEQLDEVIIVAYKVPLIDKDNTQTGGTVTSDDIAKMSGRSADAVASTVGGVYQEDGVVKSIRGAREGATVYYIDGVKVRGTSSVPKSAIEQISVITGGLPAKYGDATGGVISISTKGPSRTYFGGIELLSSHFTDPYSDNLFGFSVSGPLFFKKSVDPNDPNNIKKDVIMGFFLSGEIIYAKDKSPSSIGMYKVKDDVRDDIINNPVVASPDGLISILNAEYLTEDSFEKIKANENLARFGTTFQGKIDIKPSKNTNITIGGTFDYLKWNSYTFSRNNQNFETSYLDWGNTYGFNNSIFNYDNYPLRTRNTWRTYFRFTQKFGSGYDEESAASLIKNAYYTIQADYTKYGRTTMDETHKDNFFNYGYIGRFTTTKIKSYTDVYEVDTVSGMEGWIHNGYADILYMLDNTYPYGKPNPMVSIYTERYYELFWDNPNMYANQNDVRNGGGLLNGDKPKPIYGLIQSPGEQYNFYEIFDFSQFSITASGAADIKDHEISLGFEFEQRTDRYFSIGDISTRGPVELWTLARDLTNNHILELDLANPYLVYDNGDFLYNVDNPDGIFLNTVYYNRLYQKNIQALFDINLREHFGLPLDGREWLDIDSYDPADLSIEYFSADELLSSGFNYVTYYGYDHHGNKLENNPSFEDFFTDTYEDINGITRNKREIAPFQPNYLSAFIQDKFSFNDLVFNVGLRVDRYDANQKVLKDKYIFFDSYTAGDNDPKGIIQNTDIPDVIGDDYVVYVNSLTDPTEVNGYRNDRTWYDANGNVINDPSEIFASGVIAPYLKSPGENTGDASFLDAFGDYEAQISVMPRISFSFPISDVALFFAHYDVLTKRPAGGRLDPIDYLFIRNKAGDILNNPDLKPEKTIDYELGFQQKLTNTSSLKLSAFYREMRDMAQLIDVIGAYPVNYKTYGNIDFGTVKGLTIGYDMRRTGNISLRINYTLQFANGTGSNATAAFDLLQANMPNLRATLPFDYDQRHAISTTVDYRFGGGKAYNGPKWFGTDVLANTGVNFVINSGSGSPYSREDLITEDLIGTVNGSRKPWRTTINMRADKDIIISWGKGEDENKKSAMLNIYLDIANLLDAQNILEVYSSTGNPEDDGFLNNPQNQKYIQARYSEESYRYYYSMIVNNPGRYSLPRRIKVGVLLSF
ncbi:MAG: carboxypeptidase-like regulatory domain-containing protein [Bacteroidales bacterium]|nr:carboxypeptidase-like regulatory domain-containing protein [Bacteroidales bacterium]